MRNDIILRELYAEEIEEAIRVEHTCFPPNEACPAESMRRRAKAAPELFLAAVDQASGRIAGFMNGIATDERSFRDEFFSDASLHDRAGANVMICGLAVLPAYRGQGLARALVEEYCARERGRGRERLVLTCVAEKVEMYRKFGFADRGIANSNWGGEQWHEMDLELGHNSSVR